MRTRVPVAGYEAVAAAAAFGSRTYSESLDADSGGTDQGVYLIPAVGSTVGTGGTGGTGGKSRSRAACRRLLVERE